MSNLKRSFFGAVIYLALIFVLAETDYTGRPIINFASYFYLAVMIAMPLTLFFPSISKMPVYVPLALWAGVYILLLQFLNRRLSTNASDFATISLEFILLEAGVWFAHQLSKQISYVESIMAGLALRAFPNRARDIDAESQKIRVEFTRSRRYQRPLSIVTVEIEPQKEKTPEEMLKSVQHDMFDQFTTARFAQLIDNTVRQTDLILRDRQSRFVVLCTETDLPNASMLAKRIAQAVQEKTGLQTRWGVAAFPEDALTFEDLRQKAQERLIHSAAPSIERIAVIESQEGSKL
jgi:GGDEF domain-containing protein